MAAIALQALLWTGGLAFTAWLVSLRQKDVSTVDSFWPLLILTGAASYTLIAPQPGPRALVAVALVALWAMRLAIHITWRHWGKPEDRRYQAIRARNQPHFKWKSLVLVFALQAVLAWVVSSSVLAATVNPRPWHWLDSLGVGVIVAGGLFEAVADWQLARFKSDPAHKGKVMDDGLWRYSRHPNYFGEFCVWWGFYLIALSAQGGWWAIASPVLMTVLLLKVSGVALQEKDIAERRPGYREYINRTNAFFRADHGLAILKQ
jgi:steroid 5-alpha reductase family enzyme